MKAIYPFRTSGIRIEQPYGQFVLCSVPAHVLLDTAYSDRLAAKQKDDGTYELTGSQRELAKPRLRDIGKFIDTGAACFPNSIILAANYREEDGLEEEDPQVKWLLSDRDANLVQLEIPTPLKRAAIIDGQHRLFGFNFSENSERLDMPLVCAVFFDLPKPYQARLFATINSTQRPVNKSQTYELFGYNIEEEPATKWTPEKFAVFLARKLNAERDSPFWQHIVVPAENDFSTTLSSAREQGDWAVSLATVVEGILRLISSNPKQDAYRMAGKLRYEGHDRSILDPFSDSDRTPLRELYREYNDEVIYAALSNYFTAVEQTLWRVASPSSFIHKTVGIQALFDIARPLLSSGVRERNVKVSRFEEQIEPASSIDFSDPFFHASGASRTNIRKVIEFAIGRSEPDKNDQHYREYCRILKRPGC